MSNLDDFFPIFWIEFELYGVSDACGERRHFIRVSELRYSICVVRANGRNQKLRDLSYAMQTP